MNATQRLLRCCADSMKMPGWNDSLSIITDSVMDKYQSKMLSDDMLDNVAGGVSEDMAMRYTAQLPFDK